MYPGWPGFSGYDTVAAAPAAPAVTASEPASVSWPLGSVIQCVAEGGQSLGNAYTAITVTEGISPAGPLSFECLNWTQVKFVAWDKAQREQ